MKRLNRVNRNKAVAYLQANGRLLEQRLYAYEFEGGALENALEALAAYQNPDGGYGRALEPDMRAEASSVIATSQALGLLHRLNAPAANAQVAGAIVYLMRQFDPGRQVWPIAPPEIDAAPHAPWWDPASSAQTFNGFKFNPRAEALAHLSHYRSQAPAGFLDRVSVAVLEDIDFDAQEIGKHDFLCLQGLAESGALAPDLAERLTNWLLGLLPGLVLKGPQRWQEYGLMPLEAAPRPGTPWSQALDPAELDGNLDELVDRQLADGSWPLTWSWDFVDAQAWAQAERDWKGVQILNNLRVLNAYERLEPAA